jgi:glycosyltransferase involved in cell wall biosynthesis
MRILLVAPSSTRVGCGVGDHAARLAGELAKRGAEVHLAADPVGAYRRHPHPGLTLHSVFRDHGFTEVKALARLTRDLEPDIVHIQYQLLTYSGKAAVLLFPLMLGGRVAVAITMHDLLLPYIARGAGPVRRRLLKSFLLRADGVLVASRRHLSSAIQAGARAAGVRSINMASNVAFYPAPSWRTDALRARFEIGERKLLMSFGAVSLSGGGELLLRAIAQVPAAARRRLRCLVVGGAPAYSTHPEDDLRRVHELAQQLELQDCVQVTGFLEDTDVSALLQMSEAVVVPRRDAVSPTSTSAAAAILHRKRLLAVGDSRLSDEAMPSAAIHWSEPEPRSLAGAIRRLVGGEALWVPSAQEQLDSIAHRFSWDHLADEHCALYLEMARDGH